MEGNRDYGKDFQETQKPKTTNTQPVNTEMAQQFSQVDAQKDQEIGRELAPEKKQLGEAKNSFVQSAVERMVLPFASILPNGNINIQSGSQGEQTARYLLEKNLITSDQMAKIVMEKKASGAQAEKTSESIMA